MVVSDLGFWWPDESKAGQAYRTTRLQNARTIAAFVEKVLAPETRRVCVQAGGHVGLWPHYLAPLFETLYTFEPDATNFEALTRNAAAENIFAARGVLSNFPMPVALANPRGETGTHEVVRTLEDWVNSSGKVPAYMLDSLGLENVDAIILDVEGSELQALEGAEITINKCSPLLILEMQRNGDALRKWLVNAGYCSGAHVLGYDYCFRRDRHE